MKRHVLIFGTILGAILTVHMVYMVRRVIADPALVTNDVLGYAGMLIVFSLTIFGIRNYRNKDLNGVISLGKAFKTGALIALVGSTIYVVAWLIYYYTSAQEFIDKYAEHVIIDATRNGATEAQLAIKQQQMDQLKESYQNPLLIILMTYFEVLPIGLVVAFVGSLILKKKEKPAGDPSL